MTLLRVAWLVQTLSAVKLHQSAGCDSISEYITSILLGGTCIKIGVVLQVSSMTMSRLDAGMWENPASASSLQHRVLVELAALPASVLSEMVRQDPTACVVEHPHTSVVSVRTMPEMATLTTIQEVAHITASVIWQEQFVLYSF